MKIVDELELLYKKGTKSLKKLYDLKKDDHQGYLRELVVKVDEVIGDDDVLFRSLSKGCQDYLDGCLSVLQEEEDNTYDEDPLNLPDFPDAEGKGKAVAKTKKKEKKGDKKTVGKKREKGQAYRVVEVLRKHPNFTRKQVVEFLGKKGCTASNAVISSCSYVVSLVNKIDNKE